MSLIQRLNDLTIGTMTVEHIKNPEPYFVFIVKDIVLPKPDAKAESHFLFFIAEFEDKFLPFIYYIVKFGKSDCIYDMLTYVDDINPIKELLLNDRRYWFLNANMPILNNNYINFINNIQETIDDKLKQETIDVIKSFEKTKDANKGSAEDFLKFYNTNAFWNFIGTFGNAFNKVTKLYKEHGLVVDLTVSKTNIISNSDIRGCMSKTLRGA
jgi:hypothetical protein